MGGGGLSGGVSGWLRHLPFNGTDNRRGLALALVAGQLPLVAVLAGLSVVAWSEGLALALPAVRWALILGATAVVSLPVERRYAVVPLGIAAAALAVAGSAAQMLVAAMLLLATDIVAGPLRPPVSATYRAIGWLLHWRIAWRALGMRLPSAYAAAALALAAGGSASSTTI